MKKFFGTEFMEKTRCANLVPTNREKGLPQPPIELPVDGAVKLIHLPEPDLLVDKEINFLELIELRTSVRQYNQAKISLKDLSYLLWCTQGVKMITPTGNTTLRNVPSAGARHAFETYLLINQVEGLEPGLYRFLALEHSLIAVDLSEEITAELTVAFMNQKMIPTSSVTFIWTAVAERMTYAYGERAYRYLHLDAGHVCQNLYLAAQTINFGACAIAHFDDEKLNQTLKIDGENQFAIYAASVGK
ncbi:MAG: nitroreductase family protein [Firmicutes bacterium]|nr:nitroreductase family protein [Bacillota bacterium]